MTDCCKLQMLFQMITGNLLLCVISMGWEKKIAKEYIYSFK